MLIRAEPMGMYKSMGTVEPWHLVRKVFLLLLLVIAVVLGLVLLLRKGNPISMLLFSLFVDGSIGVATGLGSRIVLQRRHWLIRALVSASLSIVGLVLVGALTDAGSGIGPLHIQLGRMSWLDPIGISLRVPVLPGDSPTDLLDLAHAVIAMDTSWLALRAWRGGRRVKAGQLQSRRRLLMTTAAAPASLMVSPQPAARAAGQVARGGPRSMIRRKKTGRYLVSARAIAVRPRSEGNPGRRIFRKRPEVQLAAYEEHRCPYCLEDIKRDDVRGSIECPVCHTLHHKDCWDITGTCQVPHLNG
jgi:hypothetical protein